MILSGQLAHKEKIYPGQHEAIIEPELWQAVQDRLAAGRRERSMAVGAEAPSLLSGLIFDSGGARLSPTHGKRYRYYVSTALITRSRSEHPKGRRIPAGDIEGLVLDRDVSNAVAASEFVWTSAAKDALLCGSAGWPARPPARLPRRAGLWVVRASIPAPRTNGAQYHVDPFHREVPEPQERRT